MLVFIANFHLIQILIVSAATFTSKASFSLAIPVINLVFFPYVITSYSIHYTKLYEDMALHGKSDLRKSVWQLVNSIVPFLLLWGLAYETLSISIWISLMLAIPAAGFMIRIFIIFHDCCHQSFFSGRKANTIIGTMTGILTFFSYNFV